MTTVCPSCGAPQAFGLLCSDDTDAMLGMLAAVPQLLAQLDVAISKQSKVSNGGKAGKGSAHEKWPINWGVVQKRDDLEAIAAVWGSLGTDALRRDRNVARGMVDLGKAVKAAFSAIDRARDREYLGTCFYEEDQLVCHAELWAKPKATSVRCSQCEHVHEISERREWLLDKAEDLICTPREASQYIGDVGGMPVGQQRIRNYLDRGRVTERPSPDGVKRLRMGDLLKVIRADAARRDAKAS